MKYLVLVLGFVLVLIPFLNSFQAHAEDLAIPPILDAKAIKSSIDPCEDFYHYACGNWIDNVAIPADKSATYRQWSMLDDITDIKLNKVLSQYSNGDFSVPSKYAGKLGDFYSSCLAADPTREMSTIHAQLAEIQQIADAKTLAQALAKLQTQGVDVFFSSSIRQDVNNSAIMTFYLDQGGLGLPDRDYYLKTDPASLKLLAQYTNYIAVLLVKAGYAPEAANKAAVQVIGVETKLASKALSLDDRRDPIKTNNPMKRAGIVQLSPTFDWQVYFEAIGLSGLDALNVTEPEFYKNIGVILTTLDVQTLDPIKEYLFFQYLNHNAVALGGEFEKESFNFFGKILNGKAQMNPRWKTCTHLVGAEMRDALGQAYVALTSGEEARSRTFQMIDLIKNIFDTNLNILDWFDEPTRQAAHYKLSRLNQKVAYPDTWRNYDSMTVSKESSLQNQLTSNVFEWNRVMSQCGKPVDRGNWDMAPWEANAYYDLSMNEFVFPLGELLPPVLDLKASNGANFGALGATIGHELTHGYDDEGRQFDADGNLKNWWSDSVKKKFEEKTSCYVNQANQYEVLPGLFINGRATLGENLADQGGTKLAYLAFKSLAAKFPPAPNFEGFNETQQFFLSYAQSWCGKMTTEALRTQVATNVHPPTDFRVNAIVMNLPEFAEAFSCKTGSKMAPAQHCSLW